MTRDLAIAIIALLFLVWFLPYEPKISVELEKAAVRVVKEMRHE